MSALEFYSLKELQEYLRTVPADEVVRITVITEDGERDNGREENGDEQ